MKILHLNTHDKGGAAVAALRLHYGLLAAGVNSSFLSVTGEQNHKKRKFSIEYNKTPAFYGALWLHKIKLYLDAWLVRFYGKPTELFSFPNAIWAVEKHQLIDDADIIHLHWVAGMVNIPRFLKKVNKPIVWTLHDAWPFTGGFHYQNYFKLEPFNSLIRRNFSVMLNATQGKNISIIAPSKYILRIALASGVFNGSLFEHIPNGLSGEIFSPCMQSDTQKKHGISEKKQTWLFVAGELDYYRKGFDLLIDAFSKFKCNDINLIVVGHKGNITIPADPRMRFINVVNTEQEMANLLNESDVLLHTSREDNFPNTIIESVFCGTPVLALNNGGVSEIICDGVNGWLVEQTNTEAIIQAFQAIRINAFSRKEIAETIRAKYAIEIQVKNVIELYQKILPS